MKINSQSKVMFFCALLTLFTFIYISVKNIKVKQDELFKLRMYGMMKNIEYIMGELNEIKSKNLEMEKNYKYLKEIFKDGNKPRVQDESNEEVKSSMKYILLWTSPKNVPFVYMGMGQRAFEVRNCPYVNCYVTSNKSYLGDYTKFDVIAFAGPEVIYMTHNLPKKRSPHQKFVFASIESADNYPVCTKKMDGFFNWTWSYKLDSDARWGYIVVRDLENNIVGPGKEMHWIEDMRPVSEEFKEQLKTKTKAAAWFVSQCHVRSHRSLFVKLLSKELSKYNLSLDVYGRCGLLDCPRNIQNMCNEMVRNDYYFYLAFENSFSEDYVTEKLLMALQNNAVPIVYGGANYTRFMPNGIYLNAIELGVETLAKTMKDLIEDPMRYANYFQWRNHYSYHGRHETVETDDYCGFCSILNDEDAMNKTTIYGDFKKWWTPPGRC